MKNNHAHGKFLSASEKDDYCMSKVEQSLSEFSNHYNVKVYSGCEILMYHYLLDGDLVIDSILTVADFLITNKDMRVCLVDKKTGKVMFVGDKPMYFGGLLVHAPYRFEIERTMKHKALGGVLKGVSFGLSFKTKSHPAGKKPYDVQAIPFAKAKRVLGERVMDLAIARLEAGLNE